MLGSVYKPMNAAGERLAAWEAKAQWFDVRTLWHGESKPAGMKRMHVAEIRRCGCGKPTYTRLEAATESKLVAALIEHGESV